MPIISQACSCGIICNQGTFSSMPSGDSFSHSKFELKTYPIFGMTFFWTFLSNFVCMTTIGLSTNLIWLKFPTAFKGATKLNDFLISLKVEIWKEFLTTSQCLSRSAGNEFLFNAKSVFFDGGWQFRIVLYKKAFRK